MKVYRADATPRVRGKRGPPCGKVLAVVGLWMRQGQVNTGLDLVVQEVSCELFFFHENDLSKPGQKTG